MMNGQTNVIYPYNRTLFNYKKKWSTDTWCNMDEPWKHYVKGKEPDTKRSHVVGFQRENGCVCVCARARAFACACVCQREREETTNWGDENILELRNGDGCTIIFCDYKTTELNT